MSESKPTSSPTFPPVDAQRVIALLADHLRVVSEPGRSMEETVVARLVERLDAQARAADPGEVFRQLDIAPERLRQLIRHKLRPDSELFAGRRFFERLQRETGEEGVVDFLGRASHALATSDSLDLHLHFNDVERSVFDRTYLNLLDRRTFLRTSAWGLSGGVFLGQGLTHQAERFYEAFEDRPTPHREPPRDNPFSPLKQWMERNLAAPAEIVVGAALINEAAEKWVEIKLEQVADAVEVLGDELRKESQGRGKGAHLR